MLRGRRPVGLGRGDALGAGQKMFDEGLGDVVDTVCGEGQSQGELGQEVRVGGVNETDAKSAEAERLAEAFDDDDVFKPSQGRIETVRGVEKKTAVGAIDQDGGAGRPQLGRRIDDPPHGLKRAERIVGIADDHGGTGESLRPDGEFVERGIIIPTAVPRLQDLAVCSPMKFGKKDLVDIQDLKGDVQSHGTAGRDDDPLG